MKAVLVSQRLVETEDGREIREALDVQLGAFLKECGLLPVPAALKVSVAHYFDTLQPSGVVLSGGNDLAICKPGDPLSETRDKFETELIRQAILREIPILGICRGMQMLAHYFRGKLTKKEGHVNQIHRVAFSEGSEMREIYGPSREVNSYHQFCVEEIHDELKISAKCSNDGTLEAVEHRRLPIFGIMWHPERTQPFSSCDIHFFQKVFAHESDYSRSR